VTEIRLEEWGSVISEGVRLDDEGQRVAAELTDRAEMEVLELAKGVRIRANAHVGRVQLGELTITVRPKLPAPQLIRLLRYAYGLTDVRRLSEVDHLRDQGGFQELLVWQLVLEAERLVSRGLRREYLKREENLTTPRGRIDMSRLARRLPSATARPCRHDPRSLNCHVNQMLLAGLGMARRNTRDQNSRMRIGRLVDGLQEQVAAIPLTRNGLHGVRQKMNRLTRGYGPALQLIELLLEGEGVVLEGGQGRLGAAGFLFDMNRFFQALLSRFLRESLPDCEVRDEHGLRGMMRYEEDGNPLRRRAPTPRPDFTVSRKGRVVAMLDAKYRDLWENSLPRSMLYQLAVYALSRGAEGQATILYPTLSEEARDQVIRVEHPVHERAIARVVVRPIHLGRLEDLVFSEGTSEARRRRERYARQLTFEARIGEGSPVAV
jgi:5-methylcytosine-specific restriction enzyme subunit McrC